MNNESNIDLDNNILIYKGRNILLFRDEYNELWCLGKQFIYSLNYKDAKDVLRTHVSDKDKKYFKEFNSNIIEQYKQKYRIQPRTTCINRNAMNTIIMKSKQIEVIEFSKLWKFNNISKYIYKEQNILSNLIIYLDKINESYVLQYKIYKYRIDCYLPNHKIAIEIDENNHNSRNKEYEISRQTRIENELKCKFIRINPDNKQFNIFSFIGDVQSAINHYDSINGI